MQVDFGVGFEFFKRRHTADVIEMRVRQRDGLQVQAMTFERLDDAFRFVAGIDADRLPGFFAAYNAGVLLKRGDR